MNTFIDKYLKCKYVFFKVYQKGFNSSGTFLQFKCMVTADMIRQIYVLRYPCLQQPCFSSQSKSYWVRNPTLIVHHNWQGSLLLNDRNILMDTDKIDVNEQQLCHTSSSLQHHYFRTLLHHVSMPFLYTLSISSPLAFSVFSSRDICMPFKMDKPQLYLYPLTHTLSQVVVQNTNSYH